MKDVKNEALLYDFYGGLLKGRQREIYEACVSDDMSLSEISDEFGISRQAVSAMLIRCRKCLYEYEEQLHLIERFEEIGKYLSEIKSISGEKRDADSKRITELADRILGDL